MNVNDELLTRGVANIIPGKKELKGKLDNGKKINVYLGIDPTSTKIHLGHAVALRKLNEFAKKGHNVTFLIGDFTALIGDTSDKETERPALTFDEITENFKTYKKQAEKILDFSLVKIKYNSQWLKPLTFEEILKLTQHFSAGDFIGRELIKKRLAEGKRVGLHELLYPVMQGYDSFMLDTDLQIGGTDQTFNMQSGRTIIKVRQGRESFILTTPILEGPDGRKMSKSWGNAIWLEDPPEEMYAKVMSINDDQIITYFDLATNLGIRKIKDFEQRLKKENPINIKKELARQIVSELHSPNDATKAQKKFETTVQKKEIPDNIKLFFFDLPELGIVEILIHTKLASSNSEAKRLIEQGGVAIDDVIIKHQDQIIEIGKQRLLRVGKRNFARIVVK